LITIESAAYQQLLRSTPQLNYQTRKRVSNDSDASADWLLGEVETY
jgi:hypothetical protein